MTPAKPYPAPWTADLADAPEGCQIEIFHRETPIAYVRNVDDMEDIGDADPEQVDTEARATALLISAAPELLKVAEMFLEYHTLHSYEFLAKYGSRSHVFPKIQKSIAKAQGLANTPVELSEEDRIKKEDGWRELAQVSRLVDNDAEETLEPVYLKEIPALNGDRYRAVSPDGALVLRPNSFAISQEIRRVLPLAKRFGVVVVRLEIIRIWVYEGTE